MIHGFAGLPDEWKWRFLAYVMASQTPPPRDSVLRVAHHPNARFHLGSPIVEAAIDGGQLAVTTPKGCYGLDFLIVATGFSVDLDARPELAEIAAHIRFWGDRFTPPTGAASSELAASPDLGPSFELLEKAPGTCPVLARIHSFNFPATLSHGKLSGDIPGVSEGAERLARGIVCSIFVDDREHHFANLVAYEVPEILGDEWRDADRAE